MAVLVNPATGQKWEFPDDKVEEAKRGTGFVTEAEHQAQQLGEQKLKTVGESALAEGAHIVHATQDLVTGATGLGAEPAGLQPEAGSGSTAETLAPSAFTPEALARRAANPISAGIGQAVGALPLAATAGGAAAGLGSAAALGLGASGAVAGVAGAATANAALSTGQEVEAAHEEHRPIDVENIGKNFAFGAILEGAGYGLAKGIGAALGAAEKPVQAAVRNTIDRAGVAAEDLGDPAVLASARAETQTKIEATASELADAAESVKPVVTGNVVAQRQAIRQVAEAHSAMADDLEALVKRPRVERYQTLLDMRDAADSPRAQEALDALVSDRALWGDAAVDHGNALQAIAAARASGPEALADAARAVKDPDVQRLVTELDSHLEDVQRYDGQELFGSHGSTAGAADANFDATHYDKARSEILGNDKTALQVASESDAILKDASQNTARNIDTVNEALQGDLSVGEKYHDWETEAEKWTPEKIDKQAKWMDERLAQGKEVSAALDAMKAAGYDGKSYAARIADTIRDTDTRLFSAETPLARAQAAENAKRAYDRFIAGLGRLPETALETPVKSRLVELLMPLANDLRSGFEDASLFGSKIANYQRASNAAYHKMIEPLMAVNQMLTERTPPVFGEVGQAARGNVAIQTKIESQLRSYLGGGTRTQDQLATAYEAVQELVAAKKAAGARGAQLSRLREIEKAIESLRDDQQLASVVRTAMKTAVEKGHGQFAGASPAATLGVGIGGHALDALALHTVGLPVGRFVRSMEPAAARAITKSAKGIRSALGIAEKVPEFGENGSSVRTVLEGHAHRYARSLSDLHGNSTYASETFGNQAPAYTTLLRSRGANLARTAEDVGGSGTLPPTGGSGHGASGAPAANDIMTGTPGFRQAAQPAEMSVGAKRIREILARRGTQEGSADFSFLQKQKPTAQELLSSGGDPLAERLGGAGGTSTEGGFYRGSDGVERYAKFHVEPHMALNEAATANVYRDFGVRVPALEAVTRKTGSAAEAAAAGWGDLASEPNNQKVLLSERLPEDWKPIDKFSAAQVTPEAAREYVRGVPADIVLGNWDLWQNPNPGNLFSNGSGVMRLDVGEAGPRVLGPPGLFGMSKPVDKELMWEKFARSVEQPPAVALNNPSQLPSSTLGARKLADVKTDLMEGVLRIKGALAKAGGTEKFVAGHYPHLPEDQQQYFAEAIDARLRFVQRHVDKIAVMAVGAGVAFGYENQAHAAEATPPPLQFAQEPPQGADDQHAQYLAQAGARDTTATARALTDPAAAKDFARRSRGQPSTLEQFQGDHDTIQQAFLAQRSKVEQMMRDPSGVVDSLADAFGGLSPALRDQLAAKAMVIATYLHAQLPPQRGVSVMRPNGLPPAPLEARAYALKFMTATQPATAFDDAKRGQLRHEQVDTLKATWPEQYDDLRQQTLTELGNGKSTIVQRQRADLLFGFQTALDPAFSSRLSSAAAMARQAKQENTSGGAGGAPAKSRTTADLQPGGIAALSA